MAENNQGVNSQKDKDTNSSAGTNTSQLSGDTVTVQGTTFTPEEIAEANKPQPNVILDKAGGANIKLNRDNERVNARANEAPDSTDSNTGGMIAGAAKGANQS